MIRKYPSVFLLIFIVAGIVTADICRVPAWIFLVLSLVACAIGMLMLSRTRVHLAAILLAVCIGGFSGFHFSHEFYDTGPHHLSNIISYNQSYHIYGRVSDWPDLKPNRTEIIVEIDSLAGSGVPDIDGSIMLKVADTTTSLQRGDRVEFTGRIYPLGPERPGEEFDYNRYLKLKSVFGIVYLPTLLDVRVDRRIRVGIDHAIDTFRDHIKDCFKRNLEPRQAALASGFLIGETRDIPMSVYSMFRDSGTLHLLAVSGSNVALIIIFVFFILRPFRISHRKRAILLLLVIFVFAELSYEEPSVVRASIMASLVVIAGLIGRRYDLNNIIALTAVIILLWSPSQLFDVGFQLSFVTAWGLIFAVPRVSDLFKRYHGRRWYLWLVLPFVVSLVAQIVSAPVVALHFGRLPMISVPANLVIVPLVSVGVIAVLVMLVADFVFPMLGLFVGGTVNIILKSVIWCLELLGGETMPVMNTSSLIGDQAGVWLVLGIYAAIVLAFASIRTPRLRKATAFYAVILVNVVLGTAIVSGGNTSEYVVELKTIPGGIVACSLPPEGGSPDLILPSIGARDYPVDERIIAPWLEQKGVTGLGSIFVQSADYEAIDDVLRLAIDFSADTVFVSEALTHSFADVTNHTAAFSGLMIRTLHPGNVLSHSTSGYYAVEGGLLFLKDNSAVLFVDRVKMSSLRSIAPLVFSQETTYGTLVIGETWSAAGSDWAIIRQLGFGQIVARRIKARIPVSSSPPLTGSSPELPDYIIDLNYKGTLRIGAGSGCDRGIWMAN